MIDLDEINLTYENFNYMQVTQEGSCAIGKFCILGFEGGFEIEGATIGIKASKDGVIVRRVETTQDHSASFNSFIEDLNNVVPIA